MKYLLVKKNLLAAVLVVGIVAVTGTAIAVGGDEPVGYVPDRGVPGSDNVAASFTDESGTEWGALQYASRDDGDRCLTVGYLKDGKVGLIGPDGEFMPAKLAEGSGSCGDAGSGSLIARGIVDENGVTQATVVFGALSADQRSVSITPDGGEPVPASVGADRVFIAVFPGLVVPEKTKVTFVRKDGSKEVK